MSDPLAGESAVGAQSGGGRDRNGRITQTGRVPVKRACHEAPQALSFPGKHNTTTRLRNNERLRPHARSLASEANGTAFIRLLELVDFGDTPVALATRSEIAHLDSKVSLLSPVRTPRVANDPVLGVVIDAPSNNAYLVVDQREELLLLEDASSVCFELARRVNAWAGEETKGKRNVRLGRLRDLRIETHTRENRIMHTQKKRTCADGASCVDLGFHLVRASDGAVISDVVE